MRKMKSVEREGKSEALKLKEAIDKDYVVAINKALTAGYEQTLITHFKQRNVL